MSHAQVLLIAALVVIAAVHTKSRLGGSLATAAWCLAAAVFGWQQFSGRDGGLVFLHVQTPKWLYFLALAGVFIYNIAIVVRALRRRVASRTAPPPSSSEKRP